MLRFCYAFVLGALVTSLQSPVVQLATAEDWPMFGRDWTRNAVSPAWNPPLDWHVGEQNRKTGECLDATARNIKWSSRLGYNTYGDPVVASGLIWIGTTNFDPHGDRRLPDASVLACFRETDGRLLYRYVSPRLSLGREFDWPFSSLACSPWIEDDRIWFTTNRGEVVCLNIAPLNRGQGDPVVVWQLDMIKELRVHRRGADMGLGHTCSIAGYKDLIFVITGNGVSGYSSEVPAPNAPSLICLNKNDGTVVWEDSSPGENILFGQWGSPLVAEIKGRVQVIVPQGDGWVRSFHALTGEPLWQFDMNLKTSKWKAGGRGNRNNVFATPVLYNERVYVASGMHPELAEDAGRLCCIDPTKTGDVSPELAVSPTGAPLPHRREQAVDPEAGERAIPNPNSALIWDYTQLDTNSNGEFEWEERLHRTAASVAIKNDLLIAVDFSGFVHCFHATTGKRYWQYDMFAAIHASPLIVDDKVYVADEDGDVAIFNLSADPRKAMKEMGDELQPINSRIVNGEVEVTNMDNSVYTSPIYANGALYIANRSRLFAIRVGDDSGAETNPAASQDTGYWPQWRGPNRDNISTETGLLKEWPAGGPPLEWVVEGLGHGIASVSIAAGRIYTTTYNQNIEFVVCLDQRTGNLTWAAPVGLAVPESPLMRWLSQRSVSLDGDRLYTVTAQGELICLSTRDGSELWRKNYVNDFRGKRGRWGYCDFPLVDGDMLVCTPGGSEATIVALNKHTGDVKWKCPVAIDDQRGGSAGYAATMVTEIDGVRQYIIFLHGALVSLSTEGKLLWRYNRFDREQSALTPLLQGNQLFCAGGHGNYGTVLLTLVHEDQGWKVREEYFADVRLNHFQDNMIRIGEHVFASNLFGPLCLGIEDGKPVWQAPRRRPRRPFIAMTYADGHVYLRGANDEIALVEATSTLR